MTPNSKFSERTSVAAVINPTSQAPGTQSSGWISMSAFHQVAAILSVGAFGASATVDAKFQQATDTSGTGAKDISPAKAITQLLAAGGNNRQVIVEVRDTELDTANGFSCVQFSCTVATLATLTSAVVLGTIAIFEPASVFNPAAVAQVV